MKHYKKSIVYFNDGSVTAPPATFGLDPDTGMYRIGDGIIGFASNGVEALRITADGQINAGDTIRANNLAILGDSMLRGLDVMGLLTTADLGVTNRAHINNLNTYGTANFSGNASILGRLTDITAGSLSLPGISFLNAGGGALGIYSAATNEINISTNGTLRATFSSVVQLFGLVGLDSQIQGANGTASAPSFSNVNDTNSGLFFPAADALGLVTGGTERIRVDSSGNLGMGTSTFGTSATSTLALFNGTVPSSSPADTVQLFSADISAGNASLGIRTETSVVTETVTSDRTLSVTINGTVFKICLKA